jgi:hypothetical protein
MSTVEKPVIVNVVGNQAYAPSSDHGVIQVSTTSNSTSFSKISANSQNVSNIRFDVPVGKNMAMSNNVRLTFKCKFMCRTSDGNDVQAVGATPTVQEWKQYVGEFADISFAPTGLLSICDTMSLGFGNATTTITDPSSLLQIIMACTNPYEMDKSLSGCMLRGDDVYNYIISDTVKDINVVGLNGITESIRRTDLSKENPFATTQDQVHGSRMPAYKIEPITGDKKNFYLYCELESFIPSSLFNSQDITQSNFYGLDKFVLTLNLRQQYGRLFSMINKAASKKFLVQKLEFPEAPVLHTVLYTPPAVIEEGLKNEDGSIKNYMIGYSQFDMTDVVIPYSVPAGSVNGSFIYNSFTTSCLPKRLYVAIVPDMDKPFIGSTQEREIAVSMKSRNFARIDSCILTVNGTRSLVGADTRDLYRVSVENGLQHTVEQSLYLSGSPLVIDLRKDCSLGNMFIGNSESVNIGVDLKFTNLDPVNANDYKLVIVAESDAVLKFSNNNFEFLYSNVASNLSGIQTSDIKYSPVSLQKNGLYLGGSIFGTIKNAIGDAGSWVINHAPQIGSAIKTGVDVVRTLRGGRTVDVIGGSTVKDARFR